MHTGNVQSLFLNEIDEILIVVRKHEAWTPWPYHMTQSGVWVQAVVGNKLCVVVQVLACGWDVSECGKLR